MGVMTMVVTMTMKAIMKIMVQSRRERRRTAVVNLVDYDDDK